MIMNGMRSIYNRRTALSVLAVVVEVVVFCLHASSAESAIVGQSVSEDLIPREPLPMSFDSFHKLGRIMRHLGHSEDLRYLFNPLKEHLVERLQRNAAGKASVAEEEAVLKDIIEQYGGEDGLKLSWTDDEKEGLKAMLIKLVKLGRSRRKRNGDT